MHFLFLLQTAFSLWMLVDAINRGAPVWWFVVVMVPFGEWAYFFAVFLPNHRYGEELKRKLFSKPVSVTQLRADLEETPSHENRVRLAQGLHDAGTYREAAALFADIVAAHPQDIDALYGYARCAFEEGERAAGIDALERVVERDMSYRDFEPCRELGRAYWDDDRKPDAVDLLERACGKTQRIGPHYAYASYLIAMDRPADARPVLERALRAYDGSPRFIKRADRLTARAARGALRRLGARA